MNVQLESTRVDSWDAVTLTNDAMELIVLPKLGGKILSLKSRATGRIGCGRTHTCECSVRPPACQSMGLMISAVGMKCFPRWTRAVSITPSGVTRPLTDHGELWCRPWRIIETKCVSNEFATLVMCVEDPDLPFYFERTLTLSADHSLLAADYKLENLSELPMPFIWAAAFAAGYRTR